MAATKSIMSGHWKDAYQYLSSLTVWNLIGGAKDNVLVLLKAKLQVYLISQSRLSLTLGTCVII